jgi:hypothetical protein
MAAILGGLFYCSFAQGSIELIFEKKNVMLQRRKWILVLAAVVNIVSVAKAADDANSQSLGVGFTLDYFSKYVWRGQNVTNGHVFQPAVSIGKWDFIGSVWGNMDWTSANDHSGEFTELDYSLDYSSRIPNLDILGFSVGAVRYEFPGHLSGLQQRCMSD